MKHSRTIITMLLVMTVMLSSVGVFAADEQGTFSDITPGTKVSEAVTKLVGFGIINGYEDGTFKPDNQITRAEFAAVVTRMKGVAGSLGTDAVTGFSDLDNDSSRAWARPYVKAAVDLGIINGFEDGTFRAADPVTYEQAVKMLVCAAGYEIVANSEYNKAILSNPKAGWSAGYIAAANKYGFTKGAITQEISEPASRGTVAVLTSNAIDVPALVQNWDGSVARPSGGGSSRGESEENTVVEVKGIVSGTYYTGIDAPTAGVSLKQIKILTTDDIEETYDLSDALANSIDFEDLVGKRVTAYYNTIDRELTSVAKSNNKITLIDEKDVVRPIEESKIKYYTDKKKSTTVDISAYTIIYNGKYIPSDSEIIKELDQNFTSGTIELIEAAGRKFAKIISYGVYVADGSFSKTTGKVTFKYDGGSYTFPSSTEDKPVIYVDGVKKAYDSFSLREFNVINLMEAPRVGGNYMDKMYVTTKQYSGKITAELDKERIVEIGNKEIILTNMYNEFEGNGKAPFTLGDNYRYFLDCTGQLAAVDYSPLTSNEYELGYIINADKDAVSLIKKDKSFGIVNMKDKVKIDGVSTDKSGVKGKLEEIANNLYNADVCSQPVKYIIKGDVLTAIDTAANAEGELATEIGTNSDDTFIYNDGGNASVTTNAITLSGKAYQLSSSTVVIYVPENSTGDDGYSIMTPSKAFAAGGAREVKIFGADPEQRTKLPSMVLIYGTDPAYDFISSTPYMVVSDVDRVNNQIIGYVNAGNGEETVAISEDKFKSTGLGVAAVELADVDKGDIIRYIQDTSGVIAIEMLYDASDAALLHSAGPDGDYMYYRAYTQNVSDLRIRYLEAFDIIGTTQFSATKAMGSGYTEAQKQESGKLFAFKLTSSTNVYRIDEDGNLIVEPNEFKYDNISISEQDSSEIIVFATDHTNNTAKAIYIVK